MRKKGRIDKSETFDDFLASDGLLAETEDAALKHDHRRPDKVGDGGRENHQVSDGGPNENKPTPA